MPEKELSGKSIAELFFKPINERRKKWKCRCGVTRQKNASGYSNLLSHVQNAHAEELRTITQSEDFNNSFNIPDCFAVSKKAVRIHAWIEIVVCGLYPFSIVEDKVICRHIRYESICVDTLMKYLHALMSTVESRIAAVLPENFAIAFDGWSVGTTHYVAIFASFPRNSAHGYDSTLLGFAPMEDETTFSASEHYNLICFVLGVYGKDIDNVIALIGDNCSTNKSLATRLNMPLIGCASHRFNLAVEDMLHSRKETIDCVRNIMVKLKNLIPAARLRKYTHLGSVLDNRIRWSSKFEMLKRYIAIREYLPKLGDTDISLLLPSALTDRSIEDTCKTLSDLGTVTKCLQTDSLTIADSRALFDQVIADYPETKERLSKDGTIVHDPVFEAALIKVQDKLEDDLTSDEKQSLKSLKRGDSSVEVVETETKLTVAEKALKRRRLNKNRPSLTRYALSDYRQKILPSNFECQMFLHMNSDLWGLRDVSDLVKN